MTKRGRKPKEAVIEFANLRLRKDSHTIAALIAKAQGESICDYVSNLIDKHATTAQSQAVTTLKTPNQTA